MTSFVRIALVGAGTFAKMEIRAGDDISDLVERACAKFSHWGVNAGQISLYLVAAGGKDMPSSSAVDSARHLDQIGWSLEDAGISSGAWLVARKIVDGGASFSCLARVRDQPIWSRWRAESTAEGGGMSSPPAATRYRDSCAESAFQLGNSVHARFAKSEMSSPARISIFAKEPAPASAMRTKDAIWSK